MPLASRPRPLAAAVLTAVTAPLLLAGPAAAEEPAPGDTVVGELVQAFADPEHSGHTPGAPAEDAGDTLLSWIDTGDDGSVRVPTEDVADIEAGATVEVTVGREVRDEATLEQGLAPARDVVDAQVVAPAEPAAATAPHTNAVTVVMVQPGGAPRDGTTLADVVAAVDGPVRDFWREQTDGAVTVSVTRSRDWTTTTADCRDPLALWEEVAGAVGWAGDPGEHLLLYVPAGTPSCAYGLGTIGSGTGDGGLVYVRDTATSVIAHELGHNFGLGHASAVQCDASPESAPCRTVGYWDWYDVMGISWGQVGSLNAPHAARLGVLPASARVSTSSTGTGGTYTLTPMGSRSGTRVLALTSWSTRYWVEYRAAVSRDAWLAPASGHGLDTGVLVHVDGPGPRSDTSLLLDGTPSAQEDWAADEQTVLPAGSRTVLGGTFTLSVVSTSVSGATVSVTTPADDTPVEPGPTDPEPSGAGTALLRPGQALGAGQSLRSPSGEYRVVAQPDGNLVVYASDGRVLWHAHTHGSPGARTVLQPDGNLVVYASDGRAVWNARTQGSPGAQLRMQDDGNLVLYRVDGSPAWWTGRDAFDVLRAGDRMAGGQSLRSPSGEYRVVAQPDGNLVVYASDGRVLWHAHTHGSPGARTVLQPDGNLVVYASDGRAVWNARTQGSPGAQLRMQDDGNLVLYRVDGSPAWWTGRDAFDVLRAGDRMAGGQSLRSPSGEYRVVAQPDGNLVVYASDGRVLWHAHTHGSPGARTVLQPDGNLVVYASDGRAVWNARTQGSPGAQLRMQDDGNLVLYATGGRALWSSRYGRSY